jgi:hypothetical protein
VGSTVESIDVEVNVQPLLAAALAGDSFRATLEARLAQSQIASASLYNIVAIAIAREFDAEQLTFEDADAAISTVWTTMVQDVANSDADFPQPAYAIYEAFDAGEYDHGDGLDPVVTYTRPAVRRILADLGSSNS